MITIHGFFALARAATAVAEMHAADSLTRCEWQVDGGVREALDYLPPKARTAATPVVFEFHGQGGTMNHTARTFGYHALWPEALIVYLQGLNTPQILTDLEGKKPGRQNRLGNQGDRELKFFDAVLRDLKSDYGVDEKRLYATGHSNGGRFTYLLWVTCGDRFAAFAPSAAPAGRNLPLLKPKPVLHVAGEKDALVKFPWQQQTVNALRKLNECGEGKPWTKNCTLYESKSGAPVVTFFHLGTHTFPEGAPAIIVKFFQENAQR